jgi:hypothetical protein
MVVGQANNNENPKPVAPEADKLYGGRHINRSLGEGNHTWLLVRQTTTKIQSPSRLRRTSSTAGGKLIDHWARKFIHSCWSGDAPKAHKSNNGNPKPVAPEADKLYGGRHINRTLGEENRLELLVRRCAKGAQVQQRRGKSFMVFGQATNNGGGKSFIVVGQAMRQRRTSPTTAEENRSWLLVRRPTTADYKEYRGSICINLCRKLVSLITIVISFNSFIKFLL